LARWPGPADNGRPTNTQVSAFYCATKAGSVGASVPAALDRAGVEQVRERPTPNAEARKRLPENAPLPATQCPPGWLWATAECAAEGSPPPPNM
jgi:hypothetical protein